MNIFKRTVTVEKKRMYQIKITETDIHEDELIKKLIKQRKPKEIWFDGHDVYLSFFTARAQEKFFESLFIKW